MNRLQFLALIITLITTSAYSQSYQFERKIGIEAPQGTFKSPVGVALGPDGNLYVVDGENGRIEVYTPAGSFVRSIGQRGIGDGKLVFPNSIAFDAHGFMYVSDAFLNTIQKFSTDGTFISKFGAYGNGDGQFTDLFRIAINSQGNIYAIDVYQDRVQIFNSSGVFMGMLGSPGSGDGQFERPAGIAFDEFDNVYVTSDYQVQVFSSSGSFIRKFGSVGNFGNHFYYEKSIKATGGKIYVGDTHNNLIKVFTATGQFLQEFGGYGAGDGQFNHPSDLVVSENIFVSDMDNHRMQVFDINGNFIKSFGTESLNNGVFSHPLSIHVDHSKNIFVADSYNHRVQKFSNDGTFLLKFGSEGSGDGQLGTVQDIETDASGQIYVLSDARIQVFDATGTFIRKFGAPGSANGQLGYSRDLALDQAGNIYVADTENNRVQIFSNDGSFLRKFGASGSGNGQFSSPGGIAVDADGNIYVSDPGNHRVQIFDNPGNFLRTFGELGSGSGQLAEPRKITLDSDGRLFVADLGNHRIQVFDNQGNNIETIVSTGGETENLVFPWGVAIDSDRNVYTTDYFISDVNVFVRSAGFAVAMDDTIVTYGDAPFDLQATTSGNPSITYSIVDDPGNTGEVSLSGTGNKTVTIIKPGVVKIRASAAGAQADALLTIKKAKLRTVAGSASRAYGDPNPPPSLGYLGFKGNDTPANLDVPPTVSFSATAESPIGTYSVDIVPGADDAYEFVYEPGTLIIKKAEITAIALNTSKVYGDINPVFEIFYSGLKLNQDASVIDTRPTASSMTTIVSHTGHYPIDIAGGQDDNYTIIHRPGVLTIQKAPLRVSIPSISKYHGEVNPPITVEYGDLRNGDSLTDIDEFPTAGTVATQTSYAGVYPIYLAGGRDNNYEFDYRGSTLTIHKLSQTINFTAIPDRLHTAPPFALHATASSGLPVEYAIADGSTLVKLNKDVITLTKEPGTVTVQAIQTGNVNYEAAISVNQTFSISIDPADPSPIVGLPENSIAGVYVGPNPASTFLNIFLEGDEHIQRIELISAVGQLIKTEQECNGTRQCEIKNIETSSGVGVVRVQTNTRTIARKIVFE